jgi:hypothetical protein
MHSHVLPCESGPGLAGTGRRLASRAEAITASLWPVRHRRPRCWAGPAADLLGRDRAPQESYRDYMFRQSIWS